MKTKSCIFVAGVFGFFGAVSLSAESSAKSEQPAQAPAPKVVPVTPAKSSSANTPAPTGSTKQASRPNDAKTLEKVSPELAASKALEDANRKHIRPARASQVVDTAPPAARAEEKPPMPTQGLVWVPGHWTPEKGSWQWTPGEWGIPATPISVWIEAKYDPATKQWTPGYWQPDRDQPYEHETEEKEQPTTAKFF